MAQVDACATLLGVAPGLLLESDPQVLTETRMEARLGTRWAARVIMTRARARLMPRHTPVAKVRAGAGEALDMFSG